ncbi:hypothetical protein EYZ11_009734 [Aspergillus tanneri]|uniref:RNA polymerase II associated protein 1 n=1 Tax=Aspergillus tanneri TaxID=1220188 RepID=A0A4S3J979_9EURO|nr:RNA polymerase II associated protein 1 [Aspergillus tanneri]KAA8645478.1 RNA polymerase II associated protein 1 [Aspergillus tanneri]THC90798.1 hypothetical protein EYZ11_009734 [Aspergillus tanneri]
MACRGQRFVLDLDSDNDHPSSTLDPPPDPSSISFPGMIGEIRERSTTVAPTPPKPPSTGFPAHRRRAKQSAFKQRREASSAAAKTSTSASSPADEKSTIGEENSRHLASMSAAQIQAERDELIASMDSSLLERFLRRAHIDSEDEISTSIPRPGPSSTLSSLNGPPTKATPHHEPDSQSTVTGFNPSDIQDKSNSSQQDDFPPTQVPEDLQPAAEFPTCGTVHFPTPPSQSSPMPNLDPSSPSFLSDLQAHYFPNISHDPSALSWLQPASTENEAPDASSPYHPSSDAQAAHPSALRFSLVGTILSPKTSLSLPTTLGLHHHGNDPHAAGYTIPELAILSRSSFPAQRCIAWQVLGRILFRLGKGQFGDRGSALVEGLWSVIEHERVMAGMLAEADGASSGHSFRTENESRTSQGSSAANTGIGRHASASAWAVEGVWLWQTGGGGDRGVLKEGEVRSQ